MATIETYRARIDALKTRVETSKEVKALTIAREDGTACEINYAHDLDFDWGTVLADSEDRIYLRTSGSEDEYWRASVGQPRYLNLEEMHARMRVLADSGVTFRFIHQTGTR
jgi:hypothetical protein